jgi:putative ABC transport system substrate-binding protein
VCGLAITLLASTTVAQAQDRPIRLSYLTPLAVDGQLAQVFKQGLVELGYVDGRNIVITARSAHQRHEDLPRLAREIVATRPDIIVAATGLAALAAKRATSTIPIVMAGSADAVGQGIVPSLQRPGANVTGLTALTAQLAPKRLEILKEALPKLRTVTSVWCPDLQIRDEVDELRAAGKSLGVSMSFIEYRGPASWEAAMASLRRSRPDALFVSECTALPYQQIMDFALDTKLPTMSAHAALSRLGGLMSYGADAYAMARRASVLVDKVLKGARPADIPVEQPTKFEFAINLKTAKALGLTLPPSLLLRADHVVE